MPWGVAGPGWRFLENRNTPGGGAGEKRALGSAFVLNGKKKKKKKSRGDSRRGVNTEALEKELIVGLRARSSAKGLDALLSQCT